MAKLVFAVHGLRSALNNTASLARQLVDRGHDVTVVSFRDVRADVEHVGARFVMLGEGKAAADRVATLRKERGDLRSLRPSRRLRGKLLNLDEPRRVLSDLDADLTIIDAEMHGCVLAAHKLGLPSLLAVMWHDPKRAWTRPPLHRELPGPHDFASRVRVWFAWMHLLGERRLTQLLGPALPRAAVARVLPQQLNTADLGSIRSMARNLAIDLGAITSRNEWSNPHMYVHLPTMSFTAKELELDQTSTPSVEHVGPSIDPNRYQRPLEAETSERIEAFLDRFSGPDNRIAYCSMGSMLSADRVFYQKVIDAFAADPAWGLILGLGSQGANLDLDLGAVGDKVLPLSDAPQLQILGRCHVAIHPGGAGTFYECQRFAVPSIVLHTGHTDMPGNTARVTHFGLGVARDREQVTAAQLYRDATRLGNGSQRGALERARDIIVGYEQRAQAVHLIESFAKRRP